MEIKHTDGKDCNFIMLCHELDAALDEIVGGRDNRAQFIPYNKLDDIHNVFVAYTEGKAMGCASFRGPVNDTAEVKRVFVRPIYRRHGVAWALMEELESHARNMGCRRLILETGELLTASVSLYQKCGFSIIDNYGPYVGMAGSLCMVKVLK